jgi:DDE superfamily endonuclease
MVVDNYATHKTPKVKQWLLRHPRFHVHYTPTSSSWLNIVERWFVAREEVGEDFECQLVRRQGRRSTRIRCGHWHEPGG